MPAHSSGPIELRTELYILCSVSVICSSPREEATPSIHNDQPHSLRTGSRPVGQFRHNLIQGAILAQDVVSSQESLVPSSSRWPNYHSTSTRIAKLLPDA